MKRLVWCLLLALSAAFLPGCSSSDSGGDTIAALIRDTWELRRQATGGGALEPVDEDNDYRVTFGSSGQWSNNDGDSGTYEILGTRLYTYSSDPDDPDAFAEIDFTSANSRLVLEYYTDATFATTTGDISEYQRL